MRYNAKIIMTKGEDGVSIEDISRTGSNGLTDTYAVTLSNGEKFTFTVTNGRSVTSITKTGTDGLTDTYTITFNDGTSQTFTIKNGEKGQSSYDVATQSANGLMSAADKKAIDREFFRMLPKGGTYVPANADLNTTDYIKVGNYYNSLDLEARTITNIPAKTAFQMYVLSPLNEVYDNESTDGWVYRIRVFVSYTGSEIYTQTVSSGATAGVFSYEPWIKIINSKDITSISTNTIDTILNS